MLESLDPVAQPGAALLRLLVAGLLGALIGVERERTQAEGAGHFAGVRTFPIFAVLGAAITLTAGGVGAATIAGFLGLAALVVVAYVRSSAGGEIGATTETAALATYWIGVLAGAGAMVLAGAIGIGLAVLLAAKERLEAFSGALRPEELRATLTLAVLAAVILPVLPDRGYGPWGVWNPRRLWILVVVVCGLSFAAFVAMRVLRRGRALAVWGVLGGLVSSTATTVSLAQRSREASGSGRPLAIAAALASLVMLVRIAVLVAVAAPRLLGLLAPILGLTALGGGVVLAVLARRSRSRGDAAPALRNPFDLLSALKFAALYAVVLVAVEAANRFVGSTGVLATAVVAGFADVDAITLSLAGSSGTELAAAVAVTGIALAALSNTAAKAVYGVWFGTGAFRWDLALILGIAVAAGALGLGLAWTVGLLAL